MMIPLGLLGGYQLAMIVSEPITLKVGGRNPSDKASAVVPLVGSLVIQANSVHTSTWYVREKN